MSNNLPVIVLKGIVLLPFNDLKIDIEDNFNKNLIDIICKSYNSQLIIVNDLDEIEENIYIEKLPKYGILCEVNYKLELPNHKIRIIFSGLKRVSIDDYVKNDEYIYANYYEVVDKSLDDEQILISKLHKEVKDYVNKIPYVSNSILEATKNEKDLAKIIDVIIPFFDVNIERKNEYLKETSVRKRYYMVLTDIVHEKEVFEIEKEIDLKVKKNIDEEQRNFYLKEKIETIKEELKVKNPKDEEIDKLYNRLDQLCTSESVKKRILEEIEKYKMLNYNSPELSITKNYIDWLLSLPWGKYTIDNDDLIDVRKKLDNTHSELNEVKERIIEYLAVKQFTNNLKTPIICFVGAPGVGKTSLAFSIANAMNRNFVKISVGGINDEAEIIGHRKAYIGSSPGRIISSIKKAKSSNPVFLIDEIDKMTKSIKGDPASALLDVLDYEQNKYFTDNYIEEEYDLSKVFFILTANYIDDIPNELYDRLEIINLSGYTNLEKLNIVKEHLFPKICKEHGINVDSIRIKDNDILRIIDGYTKEPGVRQLERILAKIIRKIAHSLVEKKIKNNYINLNYKTINNYLGNEIYTKISHSKKSQIGLVNALAYTPSGGAILPIEVNYFKGTGKITITGLIGDVMRESVIVALDYIKSNYKKFKINYDDLTNNDIHIHVPDGAMPKDGPSAGITITTSIISVFTSFKISQSLAMTGEITLRGEILPIGGVKEKIISAYQNNIDKIILPKKNKKDIELLPDEIKNNINFVYADNYLEVYKEVFIDEK